MTSGEVFDGVDVVLRQLQRIEGSQQSVKEFDTFWAARAKEIADRDRRNAAKREAQRDAARRKSFISSISTATESDLCAELRRQDAMQEAKTEALRRHLFTPDELTLIGTRKVAIGMSERSLLCSWGQPKDVHRTVYANSEHKQYVYSSAYIYVENGVVTSFQD